MTPVSYTHLDVYKRQVIGGLSAGTEVVKKGESGDWIQIDYEGSEAYVHSSLLEEKAE